MTTHVFNEAWDCVKALMAERLESEFDKLDGKPEECIRVLQEGVQAPLAPVSWFA
jgi:hypothetical protein